MSSILETAVVSETVHPVFPVFARPARGSSERQSESGSDKLLRDGLNIHAPRASGDSPSLFQTLELALAGILVLALHVVIVVVTASRTDEEGGREQGCRAGAEFLDLGDGVGQGGSVVEDLLVETIAMG